MRSITFFPVGNGNFCLIKVGDTTIVFDICDTEEETSLERLKPFLREEDGVYYLDVLCISHGDEDHCGGFAKFREEIDDGTLVVGAIWHSDYDRTKVKKEDEVLPEDYLALKDEIDRRKEISSPSYGDIQVPLVTGVDESYAFEGLEKPEGFSLDVLNPFEDEDEEDRDVNDMSLVINLEVSGLSLLFPGDTGSGVWQERIIPYLEDGNDDLAQAPILVVSHHGSYTFFGKTREEVRDADPYPDNYEALDFIQPGYLIISAESRFPTSRDSSGDSPPHYAAWKWYHKWFRDNRDVAEDDKHPESFRYTSEGYVRLEYGDDGWDFIDDWSPGDGDSDEGDSGNSSDNGSSSSGRTPGEAALIIAGRRRPSSRPVEYGEQLPL